MAHENNILIARHDVRPTTHSFDTQNVPIEIWEHILDLIDDFPTWKICAVTCRAFLRRSRRNLYRRVCLTNQYNAELLVQVLHNNTDSRVAINALSLVYPSATAPTGPVARFLFPMLPKLQYLHIRSSKMHTPIDPLLYIALLPVSQTVTKVKLDWCTLQDLTDVVRLLNALPNLKDLALHELSFRRTTIAQDQGGVGWPVIRLSSLCLEESYHPFVDSLVRLLSQTPSTPSLEKLYFCFNTSIPTPLRDAADLFKETLHTLALDILRTNGPLVLPKMPSLRHLHVRIEVKDIVHCATLLQGLLPGTIEDLSLSFTHHGFIDATPEGIPWERIAGIAGLDAVLDHPRFSALRRLSIRCFMWQPDWKCDLPPSACREHILGNWLPSVDRSLWVDDFRDVFAFAPEVRYTI